MPENPILLIGGTSGIGQALRDRLLDAGREVICASRSAGELPSRPGLTAQRYDATDPSAELDIPDRLGGLVYLPGSILLKPFAQLSDEDVLADFELNVLGAVRVLRQCISALKRSDTPPAGVVLVSTVAVQTGMRFHASVASAKGAVEGLTRALAAEFAPRVRVNAVALSLTDTPLAQRLLSSDQRRQAADQRHPLQRVGQPDDPAAAIAWLLSADASWTTGHILAIDGGIGSLRLF